MTNEKKELFATLGLIAEESVANESVNPEEKVVELTASESVEADLKELENIDSCYNEAEKASFESTISDLELLNKALVYRNIKASNDKEEVYLESLSSEFGIATESIKEIAEKGIDAIKALIDKVISAFKKMFGAAKTQEKVLKSLEYKVSIVEEVKKGRYDIKEFARIMGHTMILGGMAEKGYSPSDFPSTGSLQKIIDIANKTVKDFHEGTAERNGLLKPFIGNLTFIDKGIEEINEAAKSVEASADFDYHQGAVKLIKAMRMYKIADILSGAIKGFEDTKKKIDKQKKSDDSTENLINSTMKSDMTACLKAVNKFKSLNSANVRALVKLCGQYLKYAKSSKTEKTE